MRNLQERHECERRVALDEIDKYLCATVGRRRCGPHETVQLTELAAYMYDFETMSQPMIRKMVPAVGLVVATSMLMACDLDHTNGATGGGVPFPGYLMPVGPPAECDHYIEPSDDDQTAIQTALIEAEEGQTVCLSPGEFVLNGELNIGKKDLTFQGAGPDVTTLDFSGQDLGANGIHIQSDGVTIMDMTVSEPPGDGIRATDVNDIVFKNTHVRWAAKSSESNGDYGLYPVGCTGVRIEDSLVQGSRDAGIYVGQSNTVLVKDSEAYENVAGIEIENTTDAEVVGCYTHDNSAGVLVFNLPDLVVQDGKRTKVHQNKIHDNNLENFADPGGVVAMVPGGTGVLVLASDNNEITNNEISGNGTAAIIYVSYNNALFGETMDMEFDPYAQNNYFHDNTLMGNGESGQGILTGAGADIVVDGCFDQSMELGPQRNCVKQSGSPTFNNVNLCELKPALTLSDFDCELQGLGGQDP